MSAKKESVVTVENEWQQLLDEANAISVLLSGVLKRVDTISDALKYRNENILTKLFPGRPYDRRDTNLLGKYLEEDKSSLMERLMEVKIEKVKEEKRNALLSRLSLSEDEMRLLGIAQTKNGKP